MKKTLSKSANNVVITGTLGGISEYLGIDPTIIRVIYALLTFLSVGFPGILLYVILAVLLPSGKRKQNYPPRDHYQGQSHSQYKEEDYVAKKEAEKVDEDEWSDF